MQTIRKRPKSIQLHSTIFNLWKPGPGSYKVDKRKNKKAKYIKIRKDFYESQPIAKQEVALESSFGLNQTGHNEDT